MPIPNYRITVAFDGDRKRFVARAPELPHASVEGESRAEAVAKLEAEIAREAQTFLARGAHPPPAIDEAPLDGQLATKVSASLHRDLLWQAREEGVELSQLCAEMLAAGLAARLAPRGAVVGRSGRSANAASPAADADNIGNTVGPGTRSGGGPPAWNGARRGPGGPAQGGRSGRYDPALLEDRAHFIEYVRTLEGGGAPGGPSGSGNGAGSAGGGGNARRRRNGPGNGGGMNRGGGGTPGSGRGY